MKARKLQKKDLLLIENITLKEEMKKLRETCSYAVKFVAHINNHLKDGQVPVCKICGKDIFTISKEERL